MKKLLLIAALFLSNCQAVHQKITDLRTDDRVVMEETTTHDQFESRDLGFFEKPKKKIKVALLLPFSGKHQELGWNLFNAASLSLFDNDDQHNIELILFDSKDVNKDTTETFNEIINQDIKIVIGPIFSSTAKAIAKKAQKNGITVISLSNNQDLIEKTNETGGIFLAGMLPEAQIDKIVSYAMSRGKSSFASISPNNQYGKTITGLMKNMVRNRDGDFISAEFYSSSKDIERAVKNIVSVFNVSDHLMEGRNTLKKDAIISEGDRIYPQVIMIPASGKTLSKIISSIKEHNIDEREFQIVGTSQWDDISTINNLNLLGAWFTAPEGTKFRKFERSYYRSYNKFPPRIASIVYDSLYATIEVINKKEEDEKITIQDFINFENPPKNGFDGIDGLFRFLPNGIVQRNLAVLQVGNGKLDTLEEATELFLKY